MSQLLEGPTPSSGGLQKPFESTLAGDQQGFDIARILWRWKWLPILGVVVGALMGFLVFTKMPAQYQAIALVQVVETRPITSGGMQAFDPAEMMPFINRTDESMVIRSKKVLGKAVEIGNLSTKGALSGLDESFIVDKLLGTDDLVIQPADKDAKTTLVEIKYVCNNPEEASAVVASIVLAYKDYLAEEFKHVGQEFGETIRKARDELQEQFNSLREQNQAFRASVTDIVWNGADPSDPYSDAYYSLQAELTKLTINREKIGAIIKQVEDGTTAGRSPEQFLVLLSQSSSMSELVDGANPFALRTPAPQAPIEVRTDTEAWKMTRGLLYPKILQKNKLLKQVGEGHPSVISLEDEIVELQQLIAETAASEKQEQVHLDQMRAEQEDKMASEMMPGGLTVEAQLSIRLNALKEQYAALESEEKKLAEMAQENKEKSQRLGAIIENHNLQVEQIEGVQKLLDVVAEKVKAMDLLPPVGHKTLKELNPAPQTGWYYGPTLPPYLLGGAVLGFVLLAGVAVLMDLADRSYRSPDEIAADLGIPVLGHIPIIDTQKVKRVVDAVDPSVTTIHHSRGRASEAFRSVRTGLFFSNRGSELKVIQITSPVPGDGKSTLSSNLAVTMAQSGRRVLLIDADFRRPRIAKIFGIETNVGMAQVVAGRAELDDATYTSCVANLSIMPGGKRPSNPAELLSSNRFRELLDVLREKYDMIIIDTPPLLAVSEPSAVAAMVDGVVLTMRLRRNVKPLATRAGRVLEAVDARLLGVVVNGVAGEAGYGYTYGYNDYRYAYRYGGNYRYGYKYGSKYGYGGYGGKYGSYSAGYLEENPETVEVNETEKQNG